MVHTSGAVAIRLRIDGRRTVCIPAEFTRGCGREVGEFGIAQRRHRILADASVQQTGGSPLKPHTKIGLRGRGTRIPAARFVRAIRAGGGPDDRDPLCEGSIWRFKSAGAWPSTSGCAWCFADSWSGFRVPEIRRAVEKIFRRAIANTAGAAYAYTDAAIDEAYRVVNNLQGIA
jgi:hypothetical protein